MGVEIVESIDELLKNRRNFIRDQRRTALEQAIPVLKAGKTMFIDKPIAASHRWYRHI